MADYPREAAILGTVSARPGLARRERIINDFAGITQWLTWPVSFLIFHLVFRLHIVGKKNFGAAKNPFIIVSNHVSFFDSFIFRLALGLFTPHLPLRFMAVRKFNWRFLNFLASVGIIDFVYSLFGVFTVVPGRGIDRNLEEAREIIHVGGNVVIYPEGKIFTADGVGPFKKGAAVLARETGLSVIPVAFRFGERKFLRRELRVNIGGPMHMLHDMPTEELTMSFRNAVVGGCMRGEVASSHDSFILRSLNEGEWSGKWFVSSVRK